jgi:hypothetical protein
LKISCSPVNLKLRKCSWGGVKVSIPYQSKSKQRISYFSWVLGPLKEMLSFNSGAGVYVPVLLSWKGSDIVSRLKSLLVFGNNSSTHKIWVINSSIVPLCPFGSCCPFHAAEWDGSEGTQKYQNSKLCM